MGMESARDPMVGSVNPVSASDDEGQDFPVLRYRQVSARVASLGDIDELEQGRTHATGLEASQRLTSGRIGRSIATCTRQARASVTTKHRAIAGRKPRSMALALNQGIHTPVQA